MRLTDLTVRNLKAPDKGVKIYHCETLAGFGCRVTATGAKSFVWTFGDHRERRTIGRYPVISLQEARSEILRLKAELTLGRHRPKRLMFGEAVDKFVTAHVAEKNKPSTAAETTRILRKQFARLHKKQLADVSTDDITRITDAMLNNDHPSAANHAFTAVRTLLRWCVRRRYLQHSPVEALELPAKPSSRECVLSDDELRAVWAAADNLGSFGTIVRLLILTGQRRGEIGNLREEWIYGSGSADQTAERTITIPSEFTKNGRNHTFPIGRLASHALQSVASPGIGRCSHWPAGLSSTEPQVGSTAGQTRMSRETS